MLDVAASTSQEFAIETALDGIVRLLRAGEKLFYGYVPGVIATLDTLPPKYRDRAATIRDILREP